ncbi:MAG: hypothetical protein PUE55_02300 [Bacteroidales bacterium]|nr:hypothetical protein [Bacteroidales bacterium]
MATKKTGAVDAPEPTKTKGLFDKKAKSLFAEYPKAVELHFTADAMAFLLECDAKNHAATLADDTVTTIKRK